MEESDQASKANSLLEKHSSAQATIHCANPLRTVPSRSESRSPRVWRQIDVDNFGEINLYKLGCQNKGSLFLADSRHHPHQQNGAGNGEIPLLGSCPARAQWPETTTYILLKPKL